MARFIADQPIERQPVGPAVLPLCEGNDGKRERESAACGDTRPFSRATEAAMKVFLGKMREQNGRNVKLYKDLSPKERELFAKALGEAIKVYLRISAR